MAEPQTTLTEDQKREIDTAMQRHDERLCFRGERRRPSAAEYTTVCRSQTEGLHAPSADLIREYIEEKLAK